MRRLILAILPLLGACEGDAERAVRRNMLDPDAAQFRDVRRCNGDRAVWSGEANGKNSFGAYTGYRAFFYSDGNVAYAGDALFMPMLNRCYSDLHASDAATESASIEATSAPIPSKSDERKPEPKQSKIAPEFVDGEPEDAGPTKANMCLLDYCPCDTTDPDYGFADITLCRNLRAGLPVEDGLMAAGAAGRDARKALREHKATYGDF